MVKKSFKVLLGVVFVALIAGCVKTQAVKAPAAPINKVALVSLSVSNWGGTVTGTSGSNAAAGRLIDSTLSSLLSDTEGKLSGIMHVTRVSSFIGSGAYRGMASKDALGTFSPKVNGVPMPIFAKDNGQLIAAGLPPEVAKKLCADLKVDGVVVVYSEWSYSQGHFVPTKRALAKNVVSVWDRGGNLVFNKRVDTDGAGVLGGPYAPIVVNEGTISQWAGAYKKGLEQIIAEMKNLRNS